MGHFRLLNIGFNIIPPPPAGATFSTKISPGPLRLMGMNIPVEISTATVFRNPQQDCLRLVAAFAAIFRAGRRLGLRNG
jgi:hypothetical protein